MSFLPAVYATLQAAGAVTALVGTRVYPHGEAPPSPTYPYVTWFTVSGTPESLMSETPPIDAHRVQVDVWGRASATTDAAALAVRAALQAVGHEIGFDVPPKDPTTGAYRIRMDFQFWAHRA